MSIQELASYRCRCGITMYALAKEWGKPKQYVNNLEKQNGKNKYCSEEEKQGYLEALYRCVMKQKEKDNKAQEK